MWLSNQHDARMCARLEIWTGRLARARAVQAKCSHAGLTSHVGACTRTKSIAYLTGDARPRFITLCSRSRCGAREAMTVGCKPTIAYNFCKNLQFCRGARGDTRPARGSKLALLSKRERYHARMARRAQHLRCSDPFDAPYVREANERTTGWISENGKRI